MMKPANSNNFLLWLKGTKIFWIQEVSVVNATIKSQFGLINLTSSTMEVSFHGYLGFCFLHKNKLLNFVASQ